MDFQANHCPIPAITVRREKNFRCPYSTTFEADYCSTTSVTEYFLLCFDTSAPARGAKCPIVRAEDADYNGNTLQAVPGQGRLCSRAESLAFHTTL